MAPMNLSDSLSVIEYRVSAIENRITSFCSGLKSALSLLSEPHAVDVGGQGHPADPGRRTAHAILSLERRLRQLREIVGSCLTPSPGKFERIQPPIFTQLEALNDRVAALTVELEKMRRKRPWRRLKCFVPCSGELRSSSIIARSQRASYSDSPRGFLRRSGEQA
jgi:hypothetical protein